MSTRIAERNRIIVTQLSAGLGRGLRLEVDHGNGPLKLSAEDAAWLGDHLSLWAAEQRERGQSA